MKADGVWRQTSSDDIDRFVPSAETRGRNAARNDEILDRWGIPHDQRYASIQVNETKSALGDANVNMTVWFSTLSLLVDEAARRGLDPMKSQFVDVGCGVGLAALYAVDACSFSSAVGLEYEESRVYEARELISRASVAPSVKDRVSIVHADAATFQLPVSSVESRCIFIFNAFGQQTLQAFVRNNVEGFTSADVIALANDVALLKPLADSLPGCTWVRNDRLNSSLVFPRGHSKINALGYNRVAT